MKHKKIKLACQEYIFVLEPSLGSDVIFSRDSVAFNLNYEISAILHIVLKLQYWQTLASLSSSIDK